MTTGGSQAAITADVLSVAVVGPRHVQVERDRSRLRIITVLRGWFDGRSEARAVARSVRDEHIENHWQQMHEDYSESWRWQANGF